MLTEKETRRELSLAPTFSKGELHPIVGGIAIAALVFLVPTNSFGQSEKRQLLKACVEVATIEKQQSSSSAVTKKGGVTCPAADIVGFPPKRRKHDQDGSISVKAGSNRIICPGTVPELIDVSNNGGGSGNFQFAPDGSSVSVPIFCRSADLTQGKRWFNATLRAQSCLKITEDMILEATLACAKKLE